MASLCKCACTIPTLLSKWHMALPVSFASLACIVKLVNVFYDICISRSPCFCVCCLVSFSNRWPVINDKHWTSATLSLTGQWLIVSKMTTSQGAACIHTLSWHALSNVNLLFIQIFHPFACGDFTHYAFNIGLCSDIMNWFLQIRYDTRYD